MSTSSAYPRLGFGRPVAWRRFLGILGLLAMGGCASAGQPTPADFERLQLEAHLARDHGALGDTIPVHYSLTNRGRGRVRACVSYEAGFNQLGTRSAPGSVLDSADRTCKRPPFELGPGEIFHWDGELHVLDVGPGMATLFTFVRIVDLSSCDAHGCDARSLIPGPLPFKVIEKSARS